jgi:hypothetical protein
MAPTQVYRAIAISKFGLAIAIGQHLPFRFTMVLCRQDDHIVVDPIGRSQPLLMNGLNA